MQVAADDIFVDRKPLTHDTLPSTHATSPTSVGSAIHAFPSDDSLFSSHVGQEDSSADQVVVPAVVRSKVFDGSGSSSPIRSNPIVTNIVQQSARASRELATPRCTNRGALPCSPSRAILDSVVSSPMVPPDEKPLSRHYFAGVTLGRLRKALERDRGGAPLMILLRENLHFEDISETPWLEGSVPGLTTQKTSYFAPLPADIPDFVKRLGKLPKRIRGTSLNTLHLCHGTLFLTVRSRFEGVMYGDRFYVLHTHRFKEDTSGGIEWSQRSKVHWTKPLPWTHQPLRVLIEKRAKAEAIACAPHFAAILEKATSGASGV